MEEEEDAKKVTNHEVFFDDKFPILRRAAATEFLIKALNLWGVTRGKDLMVNVLLKEQVIEDIIGDRKLEKDGKYECDQCDNNYTTKSSLYIHKQSKHERS